LSEDNINQETTKKYIIKGWHVEEGYFEDGCTLADGLDDVAHGK
jgi:hypothetical protein